MYKCAAAGGTTQLQDDGPFKAQGSALGCIIPPPPPPHTHIHTLRLAKAPASTWSNSSRLMRSNSSPDSRTKRTPSSAATAAMGEEVVRDPGAGSWAYLHTGRGGEGGGQWRWVGSGMGS
jgi:hypothetical protein